MVSIIFAIGYLLYLMFYAANVATSWDQGPFLNMTAIPFIWGFTASFFLHTWSLARLGWVLLIPVLSFVAFLLTDHGAGDPAYPGIEYFFFWAKTAAFGCGALVQIGIAALWKNFNKK